MKVRTRFNWLKESAVGVVGHGDNTFCETRGIPWLDGQLLVSQGRLYCMQ